MANGEQRFFGNETVEDKIRKYTKPHPIVTSHLRNTVQTNLYRSTFAQTSLNGLISPPFAQGIFPPHQLPIFQRNHPILTTGAKNIANNSYISLPAASESFTRIIQDDLPATSRMQNRKRPHSTSTAPTSSKFIDTNKYAKRQKPLKETVNHVDKSDKFSLLSEQIESYAQEHSQSTLLLDKKLKLRSALLCVIRRQFPDVSLHLVGSSCNGFASETSDADFCIMITHQRNVDQTHEARFYLKAIERLIHPMQSLKGIQFIRAKVPILKFTDTISSCDCDININNAVGIRNTHLLRTYSKVDDRVRPLVMGVKRWASCRNINDASQGTLSSYSIVLMTLHYLQCGCSPPVLQSLQQNYPQYFKIDSNVDELPMFEPAKMIPCNISENRQSIGELLQGFFTYYAENFSWDTMIMSVRLGRITVKKPQHVEFQNKYISIEEPFNQTNTARAVHEHSMFLLIKKEIKRANELLKENLSMDQIT